jgi:hypothetical protein
MTAALPLTDVGVIAAILGLFFLLVAFYKSIFHQRRKPPDSLVTTGDTIPVPRADDQPVRINDPFQKPETPAPASKPAAVSAAPLLRTESDPEPTTHVTAFRQFTPRKEGGMQLLKDDSLYVWE